jgi:hypothetical protein
MARPVPVSRLAQELGINPRKWLGLPPIKPKPPKGISQRKIDNFIDNLGQVKGPAGYLKEISQDRRTIPSVQRLAKEIQKTGRPSEVARELGISHQKWTAIRKKIEKGEAYGPELRESLKQAITGIAPDHEIKYSPNGSQYDFFKDDSVLAALKITWRKDVTPGGYKTEKEAAEWWEKIGGGAAYFVISSITQGGKRKFHVYDIRTASELKNKGKASGITRARRIMEEEYGTQ